MSTLSPDEAGTTAVKYEGWWMLVIPPLALGVHALCSYYSAWRYCNASSGAESDSLPGIVNAYTLVALGLLGGMAFWGYTRYRVDVNVESPRLKPRLLQVRNLGLATLLLSLACAVGIVAIALLMNVGNVCG